MPRRTHRRPGDQFRVGDRVRYPLPRGVLDAVVVRDDGDIGTNGRRMLLLRGLTEYMEDTFISPAEILLPAD